jgi:hypothetical protein
MDASAAELHTNEVGLSPDLQTRESTRARAARLLDAWVAGDRQRLAFELNNLAVQGGECEDAENEDGREELLLCVARQMLSEPDLYGSRAEKLHLGVWLDLLAHLSARD